MTHIAPASRRTLLLAGLAAGGGMLLGVGLPARSRAQVPAQPPIAPNAFVRIAPDGRITLIMHKAEMGQGVHTGMAMLLAEELEVGLDQVALEPAPASNQLYADPLLQEQVTGGSSSVRGAWDHLRQTGAAARMMLVAAAAQQWGVPATACRAEHGEVLHPPSGRRIGYGAVAERAARLPVPAEIPLKASSDFKLIGTSPRRVDTAGKVNGQAQYGIDIRLPGMRIATIAACPVFGGKLASVEEAPALAVPGVTQVVKLENAVAVVGAHMWAAKQGLAALDIKWDEGPTRAVSSDAIEADLRAALDRPGLVAQRNGDLTKAGAQDQRVEATYQMPFLAHAPMEPMTCTAHVRPDGCELWVGTQVQARAQAVAARITGLPPERITLHNQFIGSAFGRRLEVDFIAQAVAVAKQVEAPVKLVWTREEDIQHDFYRPHYMDHFTATLDGQGRPTTFTHRVTGSSVMARWAPPALRQDGLDPDAVDGAINLAYDLPNFLVDYVPQEARGVPTGFWRGVGPTHNVFVTESFIDELAHAAKQDPVAYRRALLHRSPRPLAALDLVAEKAGWGTPLPRGRGCGVSVQYVWDGYMATVMEVEITPEGEARPKRVVVAADCGGIVHPDQVKAQIEGGIIFGLSGALFGEVTVKDGRLEQSNFDTYRVLRMEEAPAIEVHLIRNEERPGGMGECGTAAAAPALVNAIFAATGQRIRRLPTIRTKLAVG